MEQRISSIEAQEKRRNRRSIFINDKFVLGVDESVIIDLGLRVGQQITEDELQRVVHAELVAKAKDRALTLLEYRSRSRVEIERRLTRAGFTEDVILEALARLENIGLIDDAQFSQSWVNHRIAGKPMGRRRIQWELRQKGVAPEVAEEALSSIDDDQEYQSAKESATRRFNKESGADERTRRRKVAAFLQRQGFGWEVITKVINELTTDPEQD